MNGKRLPFFALSDKYEISCSLTIKYQVFRSLDASCSGLTVNKAYDRSRAVVKNNPRFALRKTALSFFPFLVWLLKREIFACRTAIKVVITTGAQQEIARKPTDQPRPQGFSLKKWEKPWGRGCQQMSFF